MSQINPSSCYSLSHINLANRVANKRAKLQINLWYYFRRRDTHVPHLVVVGGASRPLKLSPQCVILLSVPDICTFSNFLVSCEQDDFVWFYNNALLAQLSASYLLCCKDQQDSAHRFVKSKKIHLLWPLLLHRTRCMLSIVTSNIICLSLF